MAPASQRARRSTVEVFSPVLKAYIFAYLSAVTPSFFSLLVALLRGKRSGHELLQKGFAVARKAGNLERFPACAAILVAGSTVTPWLLLTYLSRFSNATRSSLVRLKHDAAFRWWGAFLSALVAFSLLNKRPAQPIPTAPHYVPPLAATSATRSSEAQTRRRKSSSVSLGSDAIRVKAIPPLAGRTLELTTFGVVHAIVVLASTALYYTRSKKPDTRAVKPSPSRVEKIIAPSTFIVSCYAIMWSWFFGPDRLPRSYSSWITSAAQIDGRLVEALRQVRFGNFVYGSESSEFRQMLIDFARELGYPQEWGDPAKTVPIPCTLYHSGTGPSCEVHAVTRFIRASTFALRMYLPLNLLIYLRRRPHQRNLPRTILSASQSSAFLGAFVSFLYYGICLGRTRLGPKILATTTHVRQMLDGGICVAVGCFLCGWSILLENVGRRAEMALFVAPRALATVLPKRYHAKYLWRERLVFAASAATILTAAKERPEHVKGVFGRLLQQVYE